MILPLHDRSCDVFHGPSCEFLGAVTRAVPGGTSKGTHQKERETKNKKQKNKTKQKQKTKKKREKKICSFETYNEGCCV